MTDASTLLADLTRPVQQVLASVAELSQRMAVIAAGAARHGRRLRRPDLAALRPLAADLLRRHDSLAAGAGVVLAPDVLEDAPLWIEWWWADQGGRIRPLDVDLDPASAEFYDYTTTEWYQGPAATGREWVTGPYVDYICTHQYTFTISAPVTSDGVLLGVAGADVLAARVERLALPALARISRPVALVSGNGRVIASNTAGLLPGALLPGPQPHPDLGARAGVGWLLVEGDPTLAG